MRTFKTQAAQGDTLFRRVKSIPKTAKRQKPDGDVIVAHSETGHHHLFRKDSGVTLYTTDDPLVCYLRIESVATLEHMRPHDTHEPISFAPGCYEVRRQREHTPEGWRMVVD